jgi:hypothetical protein
MVDPHPLDLRNMGKSPSSLKRITHFFLHFFSHGQSLE